MKPSPPAPLRSARDILADALARESGVTGTLSPGIRTVFVERADRALAALRTAGYTTVTGLCFDCGRALRIQTCDACDLDGDR